MKKERKGDEFIYQGFFFIAFLESLINKSWVSVAVLFIAALVWMVRRWIDAYAETFRDEPDTKDEP